MCYDVSIFEGECFCVFGEELVEVYYYVDFCYFDVEDVEVEVFGFEEEFFFVEEMYFLVFFYVVLVNWVDKYGGVV